MHSLLYGGRRSGKSAIYCYALTCRSVKHKSKHVIFRQHFKDVKTAIGMETMPFVLKPFIDKGLKIRLNKTDWFWEFPNGSQIWLGGLDEKERTEKLLGMEWSTEMFNESSQMRYDGVETALSGLAERSGLALKAYYDCNPVSTKHWLYKLFIQHLHPVSNMPVAPENYVNMRLNPIDNVQNIADGYIENNLDHLSERKRKRFRDGEWQDEVEGALWRDNMISPYRVAAAPELTRIVVGVDPPGSATGAECGIVVDGKDANGHGYTLADVSLQGTPMQWGKAVVQIYMALKADRVVGEKNYGGEMVEATIRNIYPDVSYKGVTATRGKIIRAEPVSALYERGHWHHVGMYPELEDEMCSYTGEPGQDSPNRLDAHVWAATDLGLTGSPLSVHDITQPTEEQELPSREQAEQELMKDESAWSKL
jgi:hypothetical protein